MLMDKLAIFSKFKSGNNPGTDCLVWLFALDKHGKLFLVFTGTQ